MLPPRAAFPTQTAVLSQDGGVHDLIAICGTVRKRFCEIVAGHGG